MSDNCPFCEPRTSWGMSPEAWNSMREWHDKGHPEAKLKVNDVVEIDPESDNTVPSNPPLETEPSLRELKLKILRDKEVLLDIKKSAAIKEYRYWEIKLEQLEAKLRGDS